MKPYPDQTGSGSENLEPKVNYFHVTVIKMVSQHCACVAVTDSLIYLRNLLHFDSSIIFFLKYMISIKVAQLI